MIEVRAAWVPSEAAREGPFRAPLRAAGGLPSVFGVLWLVDASPRSLPSPCVPFCSCVPMSSFNEDIDHSGLRPALMTSS